MTDLQVGKRVDVVDYHIRFSRYLSPGEATHLRGYFGEAFADEVLLHHHNADGSLHYAYPRVQFKVIDRTAHLIGLAEGGDLVTRLWGEVDSARIGADDLPVLEGGLTRRRETIGETTEPVVYRFLSPWLGLNQDNHRRYAMTSDPAERRSLLERILVGNCLSLAGAFGCRVGARLTADASGLRPRPVRLKGVEMLGFLGTFRVNFQLPNRAGIGKSVSRGFGTVAAESHLAS
jgi:Cas6b C-terminal domain/Cas6b N-terminal domain